MSIDQPKDIRNGDELDVAALQSYLASELPELTGDIAVKQFPGGASNLTYLVSVGDTDLILRRPPFGTKAKSAHDMGREHRILSKLQGIFPYAPEPLAYCEDANVLGEPFYLMRRLVGIIPRRDLPKDIQLTPAQARQLCEELINVHVDLHNIDINAAGLSDFGKPQGYVARQITGWSGRYIKARTDDVPDGEKVMQWLADNMPADSSTPALIHNDYKFDNVVLNAENPLKIIGVLDWEMATLGDPLMDLGCSLAYWINHNDPPQMQLMRQLPTNIPGMMTRDEVVKYYTERSGRQVDNFDYYYIFGLFRLAVIVQQIYYRFYHKQTSNPKFGMFGQICKLLIGTAEGFVAKQ